MTIKVILGLKRINFSKFGLFRTITRQGFDLESLLLHRMCIFGPFRTPLKMGSTNIDLQGNFCQMFNNINKYFLSNIYIAISQDRVD